LLQLKQGLIDAAILGPQGVVMAKGVGLRSIVDVADEIDTRFRLGYGKLPRKEDSPTNP